MQDKKISIGILGATGMVGQRFIQLLQGHPWFEIAWLAASERSEGKVYGEAVRWRMKTPLPERIAAMPVSPATPDGAPKAIFAALDSGPAKELEPLFAASGRAVVTNSSAFRMVPDVPLVVPEVNPDHIVLLERQKVDIEESLAELKRAITTIDEAFARAARERAAAPAEAA